MDRGSSRESGTRTKKKGKEKEKTTTQIKQMKKKGYFFTHQRSPFLFGVKSIAEASEHN